MDKLIKNADFLQTENDGLWHEFNEQLERWLGENRDSITAAAAMSALKTLQDKICRAGYPPEDSCGYWMGYHTLDHVLNVIEDVVDNSKADVPKFQSACLDFIIAMITVGPTSSHVKYINTILSHSAVEFEEYFQSLRGKDLVRVVRILKKDYTTAEPALSWDYYSSVQLDNFFRYFLDSFSDEQFQDAHREFLDLYMYFKTGFISYDQEVRKQMSRFAYLIDLKYDRNPFKGLQDAQLLKHNLAAISKIILVPDFPQADDVADELKDVLADMLRTVSEEELLLDLYNEIMDLALNITLQKTGCKAMLPFFQTIGSFFYHIKETGVQHNEILFEKLAKKFIDVLDQIKDDRYLNEQFARPVMDNCLAKAMGRSDEHVALWFTAIKALLKHPVPPCIYTAHCALDEKEKLLKWKKHPEEIRQIFELISKVTFPDWLSEEDLEKGMEQLERLASYFLEQINKAHMVKDLTEPIVHFALHCLEMRKEEFYSLGYTVADNLELNPKKDKALMMEIIERVTVALADKTYGWDDEEGSDLPRLPQELVSKVIDNVKDGKVFTWEDYDAMIALCKLCQDSMDIHDHDTARSVYFMVYTIISTNVIGWLQTMNETRRISPLIPGILEMLDSDVEEIHNAAGAQMQLLSHQSDLMAPFLDRLTRRFLESEREDIMVGIANCYEYNPRPMEKHFDEVFKHLDSGNATIHSYMIQLVQKVAKYQPDLFTKDKVAAVFQEAKEDKMNQPILLMALEEIAKRRPEKVTPHVDKLMTRGAWQTMSTYTVCRILQYYALQSEERADQVIGFLLSLVEASAEQTVTMSALSIARLIGYQHRPAMEKHRKKLEKLRDETKGDEQTMVVSIIDMLDGKSDKKVAEELKALQADLADLDLRVAATEEEVTEVKGTVRRQGEDLYNVKNEVTEQGQRLDQVEETVEETVVKVEEIDGKTLSHAPFWSRDVSKLLNPEAEHDWRLLSSRLGYNNDDIRGWAQQADPCMAMLNEWYATHKTRDATHAVLTALQEMNRIDAAIIVENAMKNAEAVVEDEEFEYATPPDIFISYQWSHQNEVRLLRQHLEMAGYSCWMDVGQMGGGDKLFEKIDSGIRAAKLVISCVTEKYAKSPNCNREVNLAVSLGKPIIPLLMEKTTWPPPGSMGPIFSEYLFIRFFQRGGEETSDQRYWAPDKFQELLMQLSMNGITPDQDAVQPEYKDWWVPKIEEVIVDKNRAKNQSAATPAAISDEKAATSPDIFISYQWGRQPQIVRLYQKLTSLGYTCWLDIMQMGGGDSLYDKIDRGLRGCRVVVSCITPKYALSANCRREVSLADALHKPLIPIILEKGTWPPPGPMGPVLTQLLYIDCTSLEEKWEGPKFDELIAMINQHVPVRADEDSGETAPVASSKPATAASGRPETKSSDSTKNGSASGKDGSSAEKGGQPAEKNNKATASERKDENKDKGTKHQDEHARKGSTASSTLSKDGHDLYNDAAQHSAPRAAMAQSSCCSVM